MQVVTKKHTPKQPKFYVSVAPPQGWDVLLSRANCGSLLLYHSTSWAARLMELCGFNPLYAYICDEDRLVLGIQAFTCKSQKLLEGASVAAIARTLFKRAVYYLTASADMFWYGEPVEFSNECSIDEYQILIDELDQYRIKNKMRISFGSWPEKMMAALPKGYCVGDWATLVIDLSKSDQELLKSLKSSARKEITKSAKRGVEIKIITNLDELREYYAFACECAKRHGKRMYGFEDFETMWVHLRGWGYFETFVAFLDGQMIAGLSIWGDQRMVGELGSFQSENAYQKKLGGPDAVKWASILWAKSAGVNFFDLSGVNPSPSSTKEKTIRQFKEKWGGVERRYLNIRSGWL